MIKSTSPLALDKVYKFIFGDWFEIGSSTQDPWSQQLLNQLLRPHPERREEMCNNAACHRTTFVCMAVAGDIAISMRRPIETLIVSWAAAACT